MNGFLCGLVGLCLLWGMGSLRAATRNLIDVWTPYEGLPQSRVLSIAQTPDGALWVGMQRGWLARFDGLEFTAFTADSTQVLVSPEIQKLHVDDHGVLWIGDVDGCLFAYQNFAFEKKIGKTVAERRIVDWLGRQGDELRFVTSVRELLFWNGSARYENQQSTRAATSPQIEQYCQDGAGVIWCRTLEGVLCRWERGGLVPWQGDDDLQQANVRHLCVGEDGKMHVGTDRGIYVAEGAGFVHEKIDFSEEEVKVFQLAHATGHGMWTRSGDALCQVEAGKVTKRLRIDGLSDGPMFRPLEMHADAAGGVWILKYGNGVWHVNERGVCEHLSTANGLPSDLVETWFEDREKNIWLGTAAGLVRIKQSCFSLVDTSEDGPGSEVISVCETDDGSIWLGRDNGLSRWRDGKMETIVLPRMKEKIPMASITVHPAMSKKSSDSLWIGTVQSGALLREGGDLLQPFRYDRVGPAVRVMRADPQGNMWYGSEFGLFCWDGVELRQFGEADGLTPGHIFDVAFGDNGAMWVAKADDILLEYHNGRFEKVPLTGLPGSLRILAMHRDELGGIWLGTLGAGLLHYDGKKIHRFTREDGLPGDSVSQLISDDFGYLWGGTQQGMFRTKLSEAQEVRLFQAFDHRDGLPTAECSSGFQPACWKAKDGRLWFATADGAVVASPGEVFLNPVPPHVLIHDMQVNEDMRVLNRSQDDVTPPIEVIAPGKHRYEFHFTGISQSAAEKVRFQWRLKGVDVAWIDGQQQRSVAYSGLMPGLYEFSVRARTNDGVWSLRPATVSFSVKPFWWQRPMLQIAMIVAGLVVSTFFYATYLRRKHARQLELVQYERSLEQQRFDHKAAMERERIRIAAELHDDLGANLTQISWLGEAAHRSESITGEEKDLLSRISQKSREMVRGIDEIVWAVNPKNDTIDQLAIYVCNFAEQFFRNSPTRCRIDVEQEIPVMALDSHVRHHLYLIAKESLHNVAKHANADRVWIRISCVDGYFVLVIEDRGVGFLPQEKDSGDGLNNMRERARKTGADLEIRSTPGEGTCVTLRYPLNQNS